jgi:hypothetical protein
VKKDDPEGNKNDTKDNEDRNDIVGCENGPPGWEPLLSESSVYEE